MSTNSKLYFKCLPRSGVAHGNFKWPPLGVWTKKLDHVDTCRSGYHLTCLSGLGRWSSERPVIYLAEGRGKKDGTFTPSKNSWGDTVKDDKIAVAQARLLRKLPTDRATLLPIWKFVSEEVKKHNIFNLFWGQSYSQRSFFNLVEKLERNLRQGTKEEKRIATEAFRMLEAAWQINLGLPALKEVYR
jgi:hypothetical protein